MMEHNNNIPITQYPTFWTEEWLDIAIKELDTRQFTPEQYYQYNKMLVHNAMAIEIARQEKEKSRLEGKEEGRLEGKEEGRLEGKEEGRLEGKEEGRLEGKEEGRLEGKEEGRLEGKEEGRLEGKEEGRLEGKEEGRLEGEMITKRNSVIRLIHLAKLTDEEIALINDIPLVFVQQIRAELGLS